ncbi:rhodanese-like domain-containing protein [Hymenobacter sp. UYP22]|uniref:rhodanese-like domain-containing protein n=1 Tax=Hymenobacter sp. UYP22 TaxID=3156348 RepID=UPI00339490B8
MRLCLFVLALMAYGSAAPAQTLQTTPGTPPKPMSVGAITTPTVPTIPTPEAQKLLTQPNTVLLDVRTPTEFAAGHLKGAQNLDFRAPDFAEQLARLDPSKTYVLYCRSGGRSNQAGILMQEKGFKKVVNAGAYSNLQEKNLEDRQL